MTARVEAFATGSDPAVRGFLHHSDHPTGDGLALTHGAGSNCNSPLLVAIAETFASSGFTVLRYDLPFRQRRPHGPPGPGDNKQDRLGVANAVAALREIVSGTLFLGGHSYGGRMSSMQCAEQPGLASGLLLLSYPLHPPLKPEQLRTQHFPQLRTPTLANHGTRDPFGSIEELESALQLVPAPHRLISIEDAGHDLGFKGKARAEELPAMILKNFREFFGADLAS